MENIISRLIAATIILAGSLEVLGQVASICRPNERFLTCGGCQKTCERPEPACTAVCRVGCYCPYDYVRRADGVCIPLSECPSSAGYQMDTSEPRPRELVCSDNEEYRFCEPCGHKTCDNPNPMCPAQCARGCFCKGDLVRDKDGNCIDVKECRNRESNYVKRVSAPTCGPKQVFKECYCEKTCSDPNPRCPAQCSRGCYCEEGLYKSPSGECVKLDQCPKAEESPADHHITTVEDCSEDEEYLSCGWCEPTCSMPLPSCPPHACFSGCLCRPPLLRHQGGQCVVAGACYPQKCQDPHAEYVCRYPCEEFCSRRPCTIRGSRCSPGCFCKAGYIKEDTTGKCVKPAHCITTKGTYY